MKGVLELYDLTHTDSMMNKISELLLNARQHVAVQVNTELLSTYWNIGKIIVEHEQENKDRADYGKKTLKQLSKDLTKEFGKGFSVSNLQFMRRFYQSYQIQQTVSVKLSWSHYCELLTISDPDKRSFYEKETVNSGWSVRELKRQISLAPLDYVRDEITLILKNKKKLQFENDLEKQINEEGVRKKYVKIY